MQSVISLSLSLSFSLSLSLSHSISLSPSLTHTLSLSLSITPISSRSYWGQCPRPNSSTGPSLHWTGLSPIPSHPIFYIPPPLCILFHPIPFLSPMLPHFYPLLILLFNLLFCFLFIPYVSPFQYPVYFLFIPYKSLFLALISSLIPTPILILYSSLLFHL